MSEAVARRPGWRGYADDWPVYLLSFGHGTTHWIMAAFYVMVPLIQTELGLSYAETGLFVSILYISSLSSNIYGGYIVDVFGKRMWVKIASTGLGAAALAAIGFADGPLLIYLMLAVIGTTNNIWHPAAISWLSQQYAKRRGYVLAIHALGANAGDAVAPIIAGTIIALWGWRGTAQAFAIVPAVAMVLIFVLLLSREHVGADGKGGKKMTLGAYLGNVWGMMKQRSVAALCVMAGFRSIGQNGLMLFLPLYLANELGASPFLTGAVLSALQIGGVLAAPAAGWWADKVGPRPVIMSGLTVTTVLILVLTVVGDPTIFVVVVAIMGFALFAIRPVLQAWMMELTPPDMHGSATSALFASQALLSSSGPLIGGALADAFGLIWAFYFLAGTILIANLLTLILPKSEPARS